MTTIELFNTGLSELVCQVVLSGKSYPRQSFLSDVKVVVDVGGYVGAAAMYFSRLYPEAEVYSFEPFRPAYEMLCRNVMGNPQVKAFCIALGDCDETRPLYLGTQDYCTNSLHESPECGLDTVDVPVRHAGGYLGGLGIDVIDVLKLDVEGAETQILATLDLAKVRVLYVEFHSSEDRLAIDDRLRPTHTLTQGVVTGPHRGELVYARKDLVPE